ncbi:unnamed protein product [Prunus armeniaca]
MRSRFMFRTGSSFIGSFDVPLSRWGVTGGLFFNPRTASNLSITKGSKLATRSFLIPRPTTLPDAISELEHES